jgi:BMFP domain-containing protein YqiC
MECEMQTDSRLLDDLARVAGSAFGAAGGVKGEFETILRRQFERILDGLDMVSRDEFDAVKEIAAKAREEQEALTLRVEQLEKALEAKDSAG